MSSNGHGRSRLKGLDLQGYKTFASKSMFEFAPTITAIVGPNGSGKSNIADAIRWVLGEQSYSLLRGKRTDDMIFSGSEQRARASMAAATITFDNSDGWLPIDFSEVTVGRRAYRDGQNEYLINGQRVRLRDVAELLARCGLGERTYTIIGQGLVDAALSLKAEERRRLFEEAAGIGLYRSRREETLRRLDQTQRNLDRVQDILAELRPRLRSLERQARRAQDYEQVRGDLHAALRSWYGYHWYRLTDIVARAREAAESETAGRDALRAREEQADRELTAARLRIDALRAGLHRNAQQASAAYRDREALGRKLAVAEERLRWLAEQGAALESESRETDSALAGLEARCLAARTDADERRATYEQSVAERQALLGPAGESTPSVASGVTLETLAADRAGAAARVESLDQRVQAVAAEIEQLQADLRTTERDGARSIQGARSCEEGKEKAEGAKKEAVEALDTARQDLAEREKERDQTAQDLSHLRARLAGLEARRDSLRQASEAAARIEASLEKAAGTGRMRWEGRLNSAMRVPDVYARALAAALGPFADAFGFPTEADLGSGLQLIDEGETELEGAMVRLDAGVPGPRLEPLEDTDCLGNAADLVDVEPPYRSAVDALLGRTLIVRDRGAARRLQGWLTGDARLVTLRGEVFHSSGHVLLGEGRRSRPTSKVVGAAGEETESVRRETEAAEQRMASLETDRAAARSRAARAIEVLDQAAENAHRAQAELLQAESKALSDSQRVSSLRTRLESQETERNLQLERLAAERRRLEEVGSAYARLEVEMKRADLVAGGEAAAVRLAQLESHLQLTKSAVDDAEARAVELEGTRSERLAENESRKTRRRTLEGEQARLQVDVAEAGRGMQAIEDRLQTLAGEAAPAEAELGQTEQARGALEQEETRLRAELQTAERGHAQAQIELARREEELSSLQRRVEDDFGLVAFDFDESATVQDVLPIEGLVEHLPQVDSLPPELEGQVNRLRLQLRRMGAINPEAQREYLEVKERVEFLGTQLGDMRKAEGQLQSVIGELDELMEHEFQKTFEAVGVEFRRAFTRLFGGGSVRLSLTDPDDLTTTGIDIEARLPGRREQGLPMLSGGERSLTACALVFALLKVSPTPFCVLDEVDAMLDESNVARFREMLHELAAETQFIVITHNRQTVQAADMIYGVSMGPDSASRVISLRLDEAEREMAA